MLLRRTPKDVVGAAEALPGRDERPFTVPERHLVLDAPLAGRGPDPEGTRRLVVGMGCYWGAERLFWEADGVVSTSVGYAGGHTPHPTYEETCTGRTGHTEAVLVLWDPERTTLDALLKVFWENHDPTQGFRQGNDVGTQYRSALYAADDAQLAAFEASRDRYQAALDEAGQGRITTEIARAGDYFLAEAHHQQYLAKNPYGYCNHGFCQAPYRAEG